MCYIYRMLLLVILCVPAGAQELESGDFMLDACRGFVMGEAQRPLSQRLQGMCIGIIDTLLTVGEHFPLESLYCRPPGLTLNEGVRVVVKYLEEHSDLLDQDFKLLSMIAFREAWPCK